MTVDEAQGFAKMLRDEAETRALAGVERAVIVLGGEVQRLQVQLDGSFGGVSRNMIYDMGRKSMQPELDQLREQLAELRSQLDDTEQHLSDAEASLAGL